jgi:hypothetical protein
MLSRAALVVLAGALAVPAVVTAIGGSSAANAAVGATAAPPPAFVVAAAKREAAWLGDPDPTSAQYVLIRHRAAVEASSGATVTSNQPAYLILLTGRFKIGPVGLAPARVVAGRFATEVLDASTGRDTEFGVGSRRVPIRSLGMVGDLLPYIKGADVPACGAPDLRATAELQGATGSQLGGVTVSNRGTLACGLAAKPSISFSWRERQLSVKTTPFPSGWLRRMNPHWSQVIRVLAPRARAQVILQWFNWCGATPWGSGRGFHLTVALRVPNQPAPIRATTLELVVPPYCNQKPRAGTGSVLRVSPFVVPS